MSLLLRSLAERPIAEDCNPSAFPYSAAHFEKGHSSGLEVRIELDPPSSLKGQYCTTGVLSGRVIVIRNASSPFPADSAVVSWIRSLALRFYCESRTTFWIILDDQEAERRKLDMQENQPLPTDLGEAVQRTLSRGSRATKSETRKGKQQVKETVRWSLEPEWARATFGEISLVSNGAFQVAGAEERDDELSVPFRVSLPSELSFDEWNHFTHADRSNHRTLRPSPPSCRDSADVSVEWVVEVILDLRWASRSNLATPLHHTPTQSSHSSIASVSTSSFDLDQLDPWRNSRGFLLSKPSRIVGRVVFPVIPADAQHLQHNLSDEVVHSFAEGERKALRAHAGKLNVSVAEAHRTSSTWLKVIELRSSTMGKLQGLLTVELVTHKPFYLARTNLRGSLSLYLDWNPAIKGRFGLSKLLSSGEGIKIQHATLGVNVWTWTRGGNGKVKKQSSAIRCLVVPLDIPLTACQSSAHTAGRYKVRVPFDLRDSQGHTPSEDLLPSFKTANAEREYTLTVSIRLSGGETEYYVAVVPFQLTSGTPPRMVGHLGGIEEEGEE